MFSARRLQNVNVSFILLGEDLRIYFKSKERLGGRVCVCACKGVIKSNADGTGSKKLT